MMVISLISSVCGVIFISLGFNQKESQELRFKYYKMASFAYFIGSKLLMSFNIKELIFDVLLSNTKYNITYIISNNVYT